MLQFTDSMSSRPTRSLHHLKERSNLSTKRPVEDQNNTSDNNILVQCGVWIAIDALGGFFTPESRNGYNKQDIRIIIIMACLGIMCHKSVPQIASLC